MECAIARGLGSDLIGCFVVGFADENQRAAARLLMEEAPDSPSGRVIVYACAECGDIGCRTHYRAVVLAGRSIA